LDQHVPSDHPLQVIRTVVDDTLKERSPTFSVVYSKRGRPSIPAERLFRALLCVGAGVTSSEGFSVRALSSRWVPYPSPIHNRHQLHA
jgi:hypothetical protein